MLLLLQKMPQQVNFKIPYMEVIIHGNHPFQLQNSMWVIFLDVEIRSQNQVEWKKHVHSHWSNMTNLLGNVLYWKLECTKEYIIHDFGLVGGSKLMDKNTPNEKKIWTITIDDLPTIFKEYGKIPYVLLRTRFLGNIMTRQLKLNDFVEVTYLGMKLFDVSRENPDERQKDRIGCEKEEFFATALKEFYSDIYGIKKKEDSEIRDKAFIEKRNNTDYIMYDFDDYDNCIIIEFAANVEIGDTKKDKTIVGHIARLVNKYSKLGVKFERPTGEQILHKETKKIPVEKMWFLYFDQNESTLKQVEKIVNETKEYSQLNMIFCHYDLQNYDKMKFCVKLHNEETFVDYRAF